MSAVRVIARCEVRARMRDQGPWWVTVAMAVLVLGAVVVPGIVADQVVDHRVAAQGDTAQEVALLAADLGRAEPDGAPRDPVSAVLGELRLGGLPTADLEVVLLEPDVDAERLVRDGDVTAVVVGTDLDGLRLVGLETMPPEVELLVDAAASQLHVSLAAGEHGLTREQVDALVAPALPALELLEPLPAGTVSPRVVALALAVLFSVSLLTSGMALAQSVVEEKQSRVVEVLAAVMPRRELLVGKVLGAAVVAGVQVAVVVATGVVGAAATGRDALLGQLIGVVGWFAVFYALGLVTFAFLWAAAGALAARVTDLTTTTVVMQVLVVVPFFAVVFGMEPGTVQRVLSYLPFTGPLLMPARVVLGTAAPWEPVIGVVVTVLLGVLLAGAATRVHRGAVLHTSSRLRAREAWRAARDT